MGIACSLGRVLSGFPAVIGRMLSEHESNMPDLLVQPLELPTPPPLAAMILRSSRREDAQADDVAEAIMSDPASAARILRFVNSPLTGHEQKSASIREAVRYVGTRAGQLLSLGYVLPRPDLRTECPQFDLRDYWADSFMTGLIARHLAEQNELDPDSAFSTGLLSGVGRLALASAFPARYRRVLGKAAGGANLRDAEREEFQTDHIECGARLLANWHLPAEVVEAMRDQSRASTDPDAGQTLAAVIRVAREFAPRFLAFASCDGRSSGEAIRALMNRLDWGESAAACAVSEITAKYHRIAASCDFSASTEREDRDLVAQARDEAVRIGLTGHVEKTHLSRNYTDLLRVATTDPLTGIANRAKLDDRLNEEVRKASRGFGHWSLLLLDLDHFKSVNDTHGHQTGDYVLQTVACVVQRHLRDVDLVARYGGEEFAVLLPNTDAQGACRVAERIRKAIEGLHLQAGDTTLRLTVSIGITFTGDHAAALTVEKVIHDADAQLYLSKDAGRNTWHLRGQPASALGAPMQRHFLSWALAKALSR